MQLPLLISVCWLLVGSSVLDACRQADPGKEDQIKVGRLLRELASEDGAIRLSVMEYTHGPARGQLWLATIESSRVRFSLIPAADHVAINGAFYDDHGPLGLVHTGERLVRKLRTNGGSGIFIVTGDQPSIVHRDRFTPPANLQLALQSIDRLVDEARSLVKPREPVQYDARSVVATDGMGMVLFLVAFDQRSIAADHDGFIRLNRHSTDTGPSLYDLAGLLARPVAEGGLQCWNALNLDGGFSSAIQVRLSGQSAGVVAYRATINALLAEVQAK
jgi:uncharacterized protein YigE (DUF2233 family)